MSARRRVRIGWCPTERRLLSSLPQIPKTQILSLPTLWEKPEQAGQARGGKHERLLSSSPRGEVLTH